MKNSLINALKFLSISLLVSLLFACGGGGGTTPSDAIGITRILTDSPINGVTYTCDGTTKTTDNGGEFICQSAPVDFKIGTLELGTISTFPADNKIFPQDLAGTARDDFTGKAIRIARLLQSLDDDGTITSAIDIPSTIADLFIDTNLKLDNLSDLNNLVAIAGKALVNENQAISHLRNNMYSIFINLADASSAVINADTVLSFSGVTVLNNEGEKVSQITLPSANTKAVIFLQKDPIGDQELSITTKADGYLDSGTSIVLSADRRIYERAINLVKSTAGSVADGVFASHMAVTNMVDSTGKVGATIVISSQKSDSDTKLEVTIPEGTILTDKEGSVVQGSMLRVTSFDPTQAQALAAYPGGLNVMAEVGGLTIGGIEQTAGTEKQVSFKSAGFAAITITDEAGNKVRNFSQPVEVAMQFPIGTTDASGNIVNIGDTVPIWSYDEDTGKWTYEAQGTVTDQNDQDGLYDVVYSVRHLSYYNLDWFAENNCTSIFELKDGLGGPDYDPYNFQLSIPSANTNNTYDFNSGAFIAFRYTPPVSGLLTITNKDNTPVKVINVNNFCSPATRTVTTRLARKNIDIEADRNISADAGSTVAAQTVVDTQCGRTITYTADPSSVATVDANNAVVSVVSAGTATITANAAENDKCEATSDSYLLTVNLNPILASSAIATVDEDNGASFSTNISATDTNGDILTWSLYTSATKGNALVSGTGESPTIAYTPEDDYNGTDAFVMRVNDNNGGSATITVNITINPVNDAPAFTSNPITTGTEDNAYSYTVAASDIDNDNLTFSASNLPDWLTLTGATLSGTPSNIDVGTHNITITVSDGTSSTSQSFIITVNNTNDAPIIAQGENISVEMSEDGSPTAFVAPTIVATDEDLGDTLTWSLVGNANNGTASVSGTGENPTIAYTPNPNYNGSDAFVVRVSDNNGGRATITVNITINPVDDAPTISGSPITVARVGEVYTFTPIANDIEDDTLIFSIQNKPTWASFDNNTGELTGTPLVADVGTEDNIIIDVTANGATTPLTAFSITVSETPAVGAIWGRFNWNDGSIWQ